MPAHWPLPCPSLGALLNPKETLLALQSWRSLFSRRFQPQLFTTVLINLFQQFTGGRSAIAAQTAVLACGA
jgi:hypothetical protein